MAGELIFYRRDHEFKVAQKERVYELTMLLPEPLAAAYEGHSGIVPKATLVLGKSACESSCGWQKSVRNLLFVVSSTRKEAE